MCVPESWFGVCVSNLNNIGSVAFITRVYFHQIICVNQCCICIGKNDLLIRMFFTLSRGKSSYGTILFCVPLQEQT